MKKHSIQNLPVEMSDDPGRFSFDRFLGMSDVKIDRHGHKIVENGSNNPEHLYTSANVEELTHKLNLLAT
jgi:hypothetical protein